MKTISIKDVRQHFSDAVEIAEAGEDVVITRYGKPVARLVRFETESSEFPELSEFRDSIKLRSGKADSEKLLREMRDEERY